MIGTPAIQDLTRRESAASGAQHDRLKLPLPSAPKQNDAYWESLRNRIMVRDTIDDQRLAEIEIQHDIRTTANAFYLACRRDRDAAGKCRQSQRLGEIVRMK